MYNRYRYGRSSGNGWAYILIIFLLILAFLLFGGEYRNKAMSFVGNQIRQIQDSFFNYGEETRAISFVEAEEIFYDNRDTFLSLITEEGQDLQNISLKTSFSEHQYVSIIKRYDFGGNKIIAFRFQNKGDTGTEIIYSVNDLQESSQLRLIEKGWYVYMFINQA